MFAVVYFNNILIYSKNLEKYILYIKTLFNRLLLKKNF